MEHPSSFWQRLARAVGRALHLVARPAKSKRGQGRVVIQTYRGFGSREEMFLMGRVFYQEKPVSLGSNRPMLRDVIRLIRRILRKGVSRAVLDIDFKGSRQQVTADRRGFFQAHLRHPRQAPTEELWHPVHLQLSNPDGTGAETVGKVFVPPRTARRVVISDIDDTVVFTGVANKLTMIWHLFMQDAQSRTAFPGVAAFYRALHYGVSGAEMNPMLYVSRGPWSIYEVLDEFFNYHNIPAGPILILRDWGLTLYRLLPPRAKGHKLALIQRMLQLYTGLPCILIGDSGQQDPEIYTHIVKKFPDRILSVYIRKVGKDPERDQAIRKLAQEVAEAGSTMLLTSDSFDMAVHAAQQGFISSEALSRVLQEDREHPGAVQPYTSPLEVGSERR